EAITKLFKLDPATAPIVTANMDFSRKLNLVEFAVKSEIKRKPKLIVIDEDMFSKIRAQNQLRLVVAHQAFDPGEAGGVDFKQSAKTRVTAGEHWPEQKFKDSFQNLE